jgi:hypothetical protein
MAASIMSGLLVAAMTKTSLLVSIPSSSIKSWLTTLSPTAFSLPLLLGASASSSSKKIMQGADARALQSG